jgi:hypothetical protein
MRKNFFTFISNEEMRLDDVIDLFRNRKTIEIHKSDFISIISEALDQLFTIVNISCWGKYQKVKKKKRKVKDKKFHSINQCIDKIVKNKIRRNEDYLYFPCRL